MIGSTICFLYPGDKVQVPSYSTTFVKFTNQCGSNSASPWVPMSAIVFNICCVSRSTSSSSAGSSSGGGSVAVWETFSDSITLSYSAWSTAVTDHLLWQCWQLSGSSSGRSRRSRHGGSWCSGSRRHCSVWRRPTVYQSQSLRSGLSDKSCNPVNSSNISVS